MKIRASLPSALAAAALVAGCGSTRALDAPGSAPAMTSAQGPGVGPGKYQAGPDLEPGVYTAAGASCTAISARTADFDLGSSDDADGFIGASSLVRDVQRIRVRRGEFLTIDACTWHRESPDGPHTPDPATLAGACQILLGDGVAASALTAVRDGETDEAAYVLQDRLMAVVYARTAKVWRPAGEMVDFLDVPQAFNDGHGHVEARVTEALAAIRRACVRTANH
jgi:hypothetical protein